MAVAMIAGCGTFFGNSSDLGDATVYDLDGRFDRKIYVEEGENFVLDTRHPDSGGYALKGAVFDPGFVRLDKYLESKDEDSASVARVQYLFTALKVGTTDIYIKTFKPASPDYPVEVFKNIHIIIEED